MTLFIPDISHYQGGIDLAWMQAEGYPVVICKVGQGAGVTLDGAHSYGTTRDSWWPSYRDTAARLGMTAVPYWYVGNRVSAQENARLAAEWVGDTSLPWMLDHEDASGSIAFYRETVAAFQDRGLTVALGYVPEWYWKKAGGGSLVPGPPIVNSRYSTATGTPAQIYAAAGGARGPGWVSFGGGTTRQWQFTNQATVAKMRIDCSAYEGTLEQYQSEILGVTKTQTPVEVDMVYVTCATGEYEADKSRCGMLSGGVLIDLSDYPADRDWAQKRIDRGLALEQRVDAAVWNLLHRTSLLTL